MRRKILTISVILVICCMANAQDMFTSCLQGDLSGVKAAVEGGADINAPNPQSGQNALAYAYFQPEITRYLLEQGCDPNGGNYPALVSASSVGSYEVMKLLLENGADPNGKGANEAALFKVVQMTNCAECAELLLSHGADKSTTGGVYANLLGAFASYGLDQSERKDAMTKYGNMLKGYGLTVPDWYYNPDNRLNAPPQEMIKTLVKHGIDINLRGQNLVNKDEPGEPPLFTAMNVGKTEIILGLLENGADYNATYKVIEKGLTLWDVEGEYSPLMYACVKGYPVVIEWLAARPDLANPSVAGKTLNASKKMVIRMEGLSAIYLAIGTGSLEIVKMVAGASPEWEDLIIKALPGQKFAENYGSKERVYNFAPTKKSSLKYTPSLFADFIEEKEIADYLRTRGL